MINCSFKIWYSNVYEQYKHRMKIALTKHFRKLTWDSSIFLIGIKYTERTSTVTNSKLSELC